MQACALKKQHKSSDEIETGSTSDSNTFYEDDFSSSDGSSAEEGNYGTWN